MGKYRKKPIVIEAVMIEKPLAIEILSSNDEQYKALLVPGWFIEALRENQIQLFKDGRFQVNTLEGIMNAFPGDYLVRGVQGELYPVNKTIFENTYDQVLDATKGD